MKYITRTVVFYVHLEILSFYAKVRKLKKIFVLVIIIYFIVIKRKSDVLKPTIFRITCSKPTVK